MSLHIFPGPGWLDAAGAEAGHDLIWTTAVNAPGAVRRPAAIRADLPPPRVEGQIEKRWRGAASL